MKQRKNYTLAFVIIALLLLFILFAFISDNAGRWLLPFIKFLLCRLLSVYCYIFAENSMINGMNPKQTNEQNSREKSLRKLVGNFINDIFTDEYWQQCDNSFSKNKRQQRKLITLAVVIGITFCALAMHFLSSPERWIRL